MENTSEILNSIECLTKISLVFKQISRIINNQNKKHGIFPHSKEFYALLAQYVALECNVLFSSPTERLIKVHIQKRLVSSFTSLLYDTNRRLTRNIRSCRSAALLNILFIFTLVSKEYKERYDYLESMAVIIVKELNMMGDFIKLVAERECFSVQKMLRLPHFRIIYRFFQKCNKNMNLTDFPSTNHYLTQGKSQSEAEDADSDFDDDSPIFNVPHKINGIMLKPRQEKCVIYFLDALATPAVDRIKNRPKQLQRFLVRSPVSVSTTNAMRTPSENNLSEVNKPISTTSKPAAILHADLNKSLPGNSKKPVVVPEPKLNILYATESIIEEFVEEQLLPLLPTEPTMLTVPLETYDSELLGPAKINKTDVSIAYMCVIPQELEDITETYTTFNPDLPSTSFANDIFEELHLQTPVITETEYQFALLYAEPQELQINFDDVVEDLVYEPPILYTALSTNYESELQIATTTHTNFEIGLRYVEPCILPNIEYETLEHFDSETVTLSNALCIEHEALPLENSNTSQILSELPVIYSEGAPLESLQPLELPLAPNAIKLPVSNEVPCNYYECGLEIPGFQMTACVVQEVFESESELVTARTSKVDALLPLQYFEERLEMHESLETVQLENATAVRLEHECELYEPSVEAVDVIQHTISRPHTITRPYDIQIPLKRLSKQLRERIFLKKGLVYFEKSLDMPDLGDFESSSSNIILSDSESPRESHLKPDDSGIISSPHETEHFQQTSQDFDFELEDERSELPGLVSRIINMLENSNEKVGSVTSDTSNNLDLLATVADGRSKIVGTRSSGATRKNRGFKRRRAKRKITKDVTANVLDSECLEKPNIFNEDTLDEGVVFVEHCRQDINKITVCCTTPPSATSPSISTNICSFNDATLQNEELKLKTIPFKKRKSYRESDEIELPEVTVETTTTPKKRQKKSLESGIPYRRVTRSVTAFLKLVEPISPRASRTRSSCTWDDADADELVYSVTKEYEDLKNETLEYLSNMQTMDTIGGCHVNELENDERIMSEITANDENGINVLKVASSDKHIIVDHYGKDNKFVEQSTIKSKTESGEMNDVANQENDDASISSMKKSNKESVEKGDKMREETSTKNTKRHGEDLLMEETSKILKKTDDTGEETSTKKLVKDKAKKIIDNPGKDNLVDETPTKKTEKGYAKPVEKTPTNKIKDDKSVETSLKVKENKLDNLGKDDKLDNRRKDDAKLVEKTPKKIKDKSVEKSPTKKTKEDKPGNRETDDKLVGKFHTKKFAEKMSLSTNNVEIDVYKFEDDDNLIEQMPTRKAKKDSSDKHEKEFLERTPTKKIKKDKFESSKRGKDVEKTTKKSDDKKSKAENDFDNRGMEDDKSVKEKMSTTKAKQDNDVDTRIKCEISVENTPNNDEDKPMEETFAKKSKKRNESNDLDTCGKYDKSVEKIPTKKSQKDDKLVNEMPTKDGEYEKTPKKTKKVTFQIDNLDNQKNDGKSLCKATKEDSKSVVRMPIIKIKEVEVNNTDNLGRERNKPIEEMPSKEDSDINNDDLVEISLTAKDQLVDSHENSDVAKTPTKKVDKLDEMFTKKANKNKIDVNIVDLKTQDDESVQGTPIRKRDNTEKMYNRKSKRVKVETNNVDDKSVKEMPIQKSKNEIDAKTNGENEDDKAVQEPPTKKRKQLTECDNLNENKQKQIKVVAEIGNRLDPYVLITALDDKQLEYLSNSQERITTFDHEAPKLESENIEQHTEDVNETVGLSDEISTQDNDELKIEDAIQIRSGTPEFVTTPEIDMIRELGLALLTKEQIEVTSVIRGIIQNSATLEFEQSSSVQLTSFNNEQTMLYPHDYPQYDDAARALTSYSDERTKFEAQNKEVQVTSISKQLENAASEYEANLGIMYFDEVLLQKLQAENSAAIQDARFAPPRTREQIEMDDENLPYGAIEEISDTKITISKLQTIEFTSFKNPRFDSKTSDMKVIVERLPSIESDEFQPIDFNRRAIEAPKIIEAPTHTTENDSFEIIPRNDHITDDNINIINEILQGDVDVDSLSESVIVQMVGESTTILENLVRDYDSATITEIEDVLDVDKTDVLDTNNTELPAITDSSENNQTTILPQHATTSMSLVLNTVVQTMTHTTTTTVMSVHSCVETYENSRKAIQNLDHVTSSEKSPAKLKQRTRSFNEIIKSLESIKTNEPAKSNTSPKNKSDENMLFSDLDTLCANAPQLCKSVAPQGYSDINDPCLNSICKDDTLQPFVADDTKLSPVAFSEFCNEVECDFLTYLADPLDVNKSRVSPDSTALVAQDLSNNCRRNSRKNSPKKCLHMKTYDSQTNWEEGISQETEKAEGKHSETDTKASKDVPETQTLKKRVEVIPIKNPENRNRTKNENPSELFEELKSRKFYKNAHKRRKSKTFEESLKHLYKKNQQLDDIEHDTLFDGSKKDPDFEKFKNTYEEMAAKFKKNKSKTVEEHKSKPFQIKHESYRNRSESEIFDELKNQTLDELKNKTYEEIKNKTYDEIRNQAYEELKNKTYEKRYEEYKKRRSKKYEESRKRKFLESKNVDDNQKLYKEKNDKYHFETEKRTDYETKPKTKGGEYNVVTIVTPVASNAPKEEMRNIRNPLIVQTRITQIYCGKMCKSSKDSPDKTLSSSDSSPVLSLTSSPSDYEPEDLRVKHPCEHEQKYKIKRRKRADFTSIEKLLQSTPTYEHSYSPIDEDMFPPVQVYVQANMSVPTQVNISGSTQVNISVPPQTSMPGSTQVNVSAGGSSHGLSVSMPGPSSAPHVSVQPHTNVPVPVSIPTSSHLNTPLAAPHLNTLATTSPFLKNSDNLKNDTKFPESRLPKDDVVADKNNPSKTSNVCVVNPIFRSEQIQTYYNAEVSSRQPRRTQNPGRAEQLNTYRNRALYLGQHLYESVNRDRPPCCMSSACGFHTSQRPVFHDYSEINRRQYLYRRVNSPYNRGRSFTGPLRQPGDCGIYTASDLIRMRCHGELGSTCSNLYAVPLQQQQQQILHRPLQDRQHFPRPQGVLSNANQCTSLRVHRILTAASTVVSTPTRTPQVSSDTSSQDLELEMEDSPSGLVCRTPPEAPRDANGKFVVGYPPLIMFKFNNKDDEDDDRAWLARIESQVPDALDDRNVFGSPQ